MDVQDYEARIGPWKMHVRLVCMNYSRYVNPVGFQKSQLHTLRHAICILPSAAHTIAIKSCRRRVFFSRCLPDVPARNGASRRAKNETQEGLEGVGLEPRRVAEEGSEARNRDEGRVEEVFSVSVVAWWHTRRSCSAETTADKGRGCCEWSRGARRRRRPTPS